MLGNLLARLLCIYRTDIRIVMILKVSSVFNKVKQEFPKAKLVTDITGVTVCDIAYQGIVHHKVPSAQ